MAEALGTEHARRRARGRSDVLGGRTVREGPLRLGGRWGVAAVFRPDGVVLDAMSDLARQAGETAGSGHWVHGRDALHVTIRSLEPYHPEVPANDERLARYAGALDEATAGLPPVRFRFHGLSPHAAGVAVTAQPADGTADALRERLTHVLDAAGITGVESSARTTWYVNLVHFAAAVAAPERLVAWCDERSDLPVGTAEVATAELVRWHQVGTGVRPVNPASRRAHGPEPQPGPNREVSWRVSPHHRRGHTRDLKTIMKPAAVIVLAAGEGTRMKSRTPKVLHAIGGRSLLGYAVRVGRALEPEHLAVVVGHGRDKVVPHLGDVDPGALPVVQAEQLGTGHAVRTALEAMPALEGTVVVTYADVPLLGEPTLRQLLAVHGERKAAATVLTAEVADPTGYGRILRGADGSVAGIVEHKDADAGQREIAEINSGIYAFDAELLTDALGKVQTDNAQGEEYLTDVLGILRDEGRAVAAVMTADDAEILGVNDRVQLAEMHRRVNDRILRRWMLSGVTVIDPMSTWVDDTVTLEPDVTLHPNTILRGTTAVARDAEVGPDTTLTDTRVDEGARVVRTHSVGAVVGAGANVGPYASLRPGTRLGERGKIGTFVETKEAAIGAGAKVPHLTYVGDATIGAGSNIGAGTIFANYDGVHKHHTYVGRHTFVGSDAVLVAPVNLADGVYVAAGSAVIKDVEPGELAVARGQQRNIAGWVARKRAGTNTAAAAAEAAARDNGPDENHDRER